MALTKDQRRHIENRITVATNTLREKLGYEQWFKSPPELKREERRVARLRERLMQAHERRKAQISRRVGARVEAAREALLFGDEKKALAAVKLLEKAAGR